MKANSQIILSLFRATKDLKHGCRKCNRRILKGELYRKSDNSEMVFCGYCVGLFLSRYSYTFIILDPTELELAEKLRRDEEVKEINLETREWMWLDSVWMGV